MNITDTKSNGKTYTPEWVVKVILDNVGYTKDIWSKTIIEPACGDGQIMEEIVTRFLNDIKNVKISNPSKKKLLENNIVGIDIDDEALDICRNRLSAVAAKYGISNVKWNLHKSDSTEIGNIEKYKSKFDFCVGNPPYIRIQHLGEARRKSIQSQWKLSATGATDMFITFFEIGMYLLKDDGKLGYITPNSYFKTKAGKHLRKFLKDNKSIVSIVDFRSTQVFDDVSTYTAITTIDKALKSDTFSYFDGNGKTKSVIYRRKVALQSLDDDNWSFCAVNLNAELNRIRQDGRPLCEIATINTGLATLANHIYVFSPTNSDVPGCVTLTQKGGCTFPIEKGILKSAVKASTIKESDENQNLFIIFPYEKNDQGKHVIIPEDKLKSEYPNAYAYLQKMKPVLDSRDKGKPNPIAWYAFGRTQGLDSSFGAKILTAPMNLTPNFIVRMQQDETFFDGYCIKPKRFSRSMLVTLAKCLNSEKMATFIGATSKSYGSNYKSYAKGFIKNFGVNLENP